MTPTITTRSLVLRPLVKATQRNVDWLRDPVVVEYSEQRHRVHTLTTCLSYINSLKPYGHIWGIWTARNDQHIGNIVADVDQPNNVADVSILIGNQEYWGKGLGTEAWATACNWLLDKDCGGLRKLEAGCMAVNVAMRRVLDRSKFEYEGERKNHFIYKPGQPVGAVYYGRFR